MTNPPEQQTPSDAVGARVREVRRRRDWTAAELADRCAEMGSPEITSSVVTDLETGRRDKATGRRRRNITVDELLILARALDVAPVHLLVPTKGNPPYPVTAKWSVAPARAREWIRGREPLPSGDPRIFFSEVPAAEFVNARLAEAREQGRPTMSDVQAAETDRVDVERQRRAEDGD